MAAIAVSSAATAGDSTSGLATKGALIVLVVYLIVVGALVIGLRRLIQELMRKRGLDSRKRLPRGLEAMLWLAFFVVLWWWYR